MNSLAASTEGIAMPESPRVLAGKQRRRLNRFFKSSHKDWAAGGQGLQEYRERFACYLEQLDQDGRKGAFALTFKHVQDNRYGIADRYYEPYGIPAGLVRMPLPIEQALYPFSELAPVTLNG
jgi:hypothetical protein